MFRNKKKTYPTPAKPSLIVNNQTRQPIEVDELGNPVNGTPVYDEFPSKSQAKKALAKIVKGLPPKALPSDPPLYSVEVIR